MFILIIVWSLRLQWKHIWKYELCEDSLSLTTKTYNKSDYNNVAASISPSAPSSDNETSAMSCSLCWRWLWRGLGHNAPLVFGRAVAVDSLHLLLQTDWMKRCGGGESARAQVFRRFHKTERDGSKLRPNSGGSSRTGELGRLPWNTWWFMEEVMWGYRCCRGIDFPAQ